MMIPAHRRKVRLASLLEILANQAKRLERRNHVFDAVQQQHQIKLANRCQLLVFLGNVKVEIPGLGVQLPC